MRRSSDWRQKARRRIDRVVAIYLKNYPERPINWKQLRTEISKAYPFGNRENHPYKIWLSEVKEAIAFYKEHNNNSRPSCPVEAMPYRKKCYSPLRGKPKAPPPVPPGQLKLDLWNNDN